MSAGTKPSLAAWKRVRDAIRPEPPPLARADEIAGPARSAVALAAQEAANDVLLAENGKLRAALVGARVVVAEAAATPWFAAVWLASPLQPARAGRTLAAIDAALALKGDIRRGGRP